jgi:TolB-like protein
MEPAPPTPGSSDADFRLGGWLVQPSLGRISGVQGAIHLRPLLMDLLGLLARNAGRPVTKEEISRTIWGKRFLAESALTRLVAELRHILGDDSENPRFVETIPKRGYRLIAPVSVEGSAAPGPSIAVLPFTDMAQAKDQEYFCDGLAEELTNALTRVRGLRVIARTSAFAFKGKALDAREIGRQLNVSAVVEGGVQRSADRLRVTVQVINAADGSHLWSERFDRRASDIFAIEDEIAQALVAGLGVKLLGDEASALIPRHTEDLEAHDLYLRGRYIAARRTPNAYAQAIRYFRQALARDPGYSVAYAALGACYCGSGFVSYLAARGRLSQGEGGGCKGAGTQSRARRSSCHSWMGRLGLRLGLARSRGLFSSGGGAEPKRWDDPLLACDDACGAGAFRRSSGRSRAGLGSRSAVAGDSDERRLYTVRGS